MIDRRYESSFKEIRSYLGGAAIKYGSLMGGVYEMCKDEKNIPVILLSGVGYLLGRCLEGLGTEIRNKRNFSNLEESLKK